MSDMYWYRFGRLFVREPGDKLPLQALIHSWTNSYRLSSTMRNKLVELKRSGDYSFSIALWQEHNDLYVGIFGEGEFPEELSAKTQDILAGARRIELTSEQKKNLHSHVLV